MVLADPAVVAMAEPQVQPLFRHSPPDSNLGSCPISVPERVIICRLEELPVRSQRHGTVLQAEIKLAIRGRRLIPHRFAAKRAIEFHARVNDFHSAPMMRARANLVKDGSSTLPTTIDPSGLRLR